MVLKILLGNTRELWACAASPPDAAFQNYCKYRPVWSSLLAPVSTCVLPWPDLDSAEHKAVQGFSRNSPRDLNANKNKFCPLKWLTQVRLGKWQQPVWELFSVAEFVFCTLAPQFLLLHTEVPSGKLNSCSSWESAVARWDLVFCLTSCSFPLAMRSSLPEEFHMVAQGIQTLHLGKELCLFWSLNSR